MEKLRDYGYYKLLTTSSSEKHYIMDDVVYSEAEFKIKMFGDHFMNSENKGEKVNYNTDIVAEIDDLNQYLEGNVTKMGLIEGLEGLLRIIRK
tara:strand:- start:59 stop:337 length:279 start_codon:yes stop_codon:yes gene_type:complete